MLKQAVHYLCFENLGVLFWGRRPEANVEVDHPQCCGDVLDQLAVLVSHDGGPGIEVTKKN